MTYGAEESADWLAAMRKKLGDAAGQGMLFTHIGSKNALQCSMLSAPILKRPFATGLGIPVNCLLPISLWRQQK